MSLTSTKQGRLAIIAMVVVAILVAITAFDRTTSSAADRQARSFARAADEKLAHIRRDDLDQARADAKVADWDGTDSPFDVEGRLPERVTEVAGGVVARYRLRASGAERCVDAMWPDDGPLAVRVNECEGYDRP
jgi:hypothetical protein